MAPTLNESVICGSALSKVYGGEDSVHDLINAQASMERYSASTSTWRDLVGQQKRSSFLDLVTAIQKFSALGKNWDGQGAIPITAQVIEHATKLGSMLSTLPAIDVSPNPNGTISFYFEVAGSQVEIELGRTRYRATVIHSDGLEGMSGEISELMQMGGAAAFMAPRPKRVTRALPAPTRLAASRVEFCSTWHEELGALEAA